MAMQRRRTSKSGTEMVYRHPLLVRVSHWLNAVAMVVLLFSGFQILNAHPAFYWGEVSRFDAPAFAVTTEMADDGSLKGHLVIGDWRLETTGVLGASRDADGYLQPRAMPAWLTLPGYPDLGAGRAWHFFFAWILVFNGVAYLAYLMASGRLGGLLLPSLEELRRVPRSVLDHIRLRFAHGEDAAGYNVLQKLAYLVVIFVLAPGMLVTGLAMSPAMDAVFPFLTQIFGRQTMRTLHFLFAGSLVLFVLVHLAMVVAAGPVNEVRSMITGWFALPRSRAPSSGDKVQASGDAP